MPFLPIENYGLIGNMRSAALVGTNGSIDWYCFPHFDSPSIFAAMLDDDKGGRFQIAPTTKDYRPKQFYWPETNVLVTRFHDEHGIAEVIDLMPVGKQLQSEEDFLLIRIVKGIHGKVNMRLHCAPAFDYARADHQLSINDKGATFHSEELDMALSATIPLKKQDNSVLTEFDVETEQTEVFVFHKVGPEETCSLTFSRERAQEEFEKTITYWRNWLSQSQYRGRWRETVHRSALVLKLLTFEPTGAIVAAPTCSLPEHIGGKRNWDYRFTWVRDAAFTIYAFMRIGFTKEAGAFMNWIMERCSASEHNGTLHVMYSINGESNLEEETLDHLSGYQDSAPVRIGNGAFDQLQLDIYGELMDSAYLYNKYGAPISYQQWCQLVKHIDWVCDNWQLEDEGIWEVRSGRKHFVYSKMMCWVALDRGIRLAGKRSFPADVHRWREIRDEIYLEIMEKGWNEELQAFVQSYGSDTLDAANLMMPLVFFVSPTDPRMVKTLEASMKSPADGGLLTNSLVYRYNNKEAADGLEDEEGTFNICTFWLVEALTRAGQADPDKLKEAHLMFEQMMGYANHLGIFSEQIGLRGEALGNTPQAFTHLALISAAFNLNKALGS